MRSLKKIDTCLRRKLLMLHQDHAAQNIQRDRFNLYDMNRKILVYILNIKQIEESCEKFNYFKMKNKVFVYDSCSAVPL